MAKQTLDAVKTARSIHDGDYSSLRGKSFLICDNMKKNKETIYHPGGKTVKKSRMDRFEERMDQLESSINKLSEEMRNGFNELRQDIKGINARLDYNGLQIEQINKRLDYNGLKKLPENR